MVVEFSLASFSGNYNDMCSSNGPRSYQLMLGFSQSRSCLQHYLNVVNLQFESLPTAVTSLASHFTLH